MKKPKIATIVIICLIVLFAVLIAVNHFSDGNQAAASPGANPRGGIQQATTVRVTPVEPGTIERSVILNGEILARNQVTIFPTVGGRLVESFFQIGDRVNAGTVVAMVDPSRPGEVFSRSPIVSTVAGTVLQAPFNIGDTLTPNSPVFVVGDLSALIIETFVPERFAANVRHGMQATLRVEALPGETFTAEIFEINPVLDPVSRTLRIRLRFLRPDPRIRAGMFATLNLVTERRDNILVIPRMAAISTYSSSFVFIVDEYDTAHRRDVIFGMENEDYLEILGGVQRGEMVVTAGQNFLSDGDLVRIIE